MPNESDSLLTVVVARRIREGHEEEYERTMRDFVAWSLTQPGHEGLHVLRPARGERDYTVVSNFRDVAARRAYTGSSEYASWMERFAPLTEGDPRIRELTGLEAFVSMPGRALRRPPHGKLAVATFLGVFPTSVFLGETIGPRIAAWPLLVRAAVFAASMVAMLTWIVMPLVTRALHGWLFPERASESKT
jgi:hypothetical protein